MVLIDADVVNMLVSRSCLCWITNPSPYKRGGELTAGYKAVNSAVARQLLAGNCPATAVQFGQNTVARQLHGSCRKQPCSCGFQLRQPPGRLLGNSGATPLQLPASQPAVAVRLQGGNKAVISPPRL